MAETKVTEASLIKKVWQLADIMAGAGRCIRRMVELGG